MRYHLVGNRAGLVTGYPSWLQFTATSHNANTLRAKGRSDQPLRGETQTVGQSTYAFVSIPLEVVEIAPAFSSQLIVVTLIFEEKTAHRCRWATSCSFGGRAITAAVLAPERKELSACSPEE